MEQRQYDVIVVGGGAIGCMSAWRLAQTGRKVLVLEKGQLGAESSSAAAGMLGAQMEMHEEGPMFRLCIESRGLFSHLVEELWQETGLRVGLQETGILRLATSVERVAELHGRGQWQTALGQQCQWWDKAALTDREPDVSSDYGGMFFPDDASLSASLFSKALAVACHQSCDVMEGTLVERIEPASTGVRISAGGKQFQGDFVVIAAGAWAKTLLKDVRVEFPVYPVKGQILSVRPRKPLLSTVVFADDVYLVPKTDGTIVVGATEEHSAGYDRRVTVEGLGTLLRNAQVIVPALADAAVERVWVGLRPGSPTGLPLIGPLANDHRIILTSGHFRNGILLTPATAQIVIDSVIGNPLSEFAKPFLPPTDAVEVAQS